MTQEDTKKRGLGRGLSALFEDEENEAYGSDAALKPSKLNVAHLRPGTYQPRRHFDDSAIEQLAESIRAHGVLQPLLVRPIGEDEYEIIAGERRWRASQAAKLHEVPVIIQDLTDEEALEIALIENLQRQDLTPLEEADGYKQLIDKFGHTQEKLAQQLGKSRSHIANMMRLLALPAEVKTMLDEGVITSGHARALLSADDPLAVARRVVEEGLNVRQTERVAAGKEVAKDPEDTVTAAKDKPVANDVPREKDEDTLALEREMTNELGMKLSIDQRGEGGRLSIDYKDLDQLDELLARLRHDPHSMDDAMEG